MAHCLDNRSNRFYHPSYALASVESEQPVGTKSAESGTEAEPYEEYSEGRTLHHEKAAQTLSTMQSLCSPSEWERPQSADLRRGQPGSIIFGSEPHLANSDYCFPLFICESINPPMLPLGDKDNDDN
jgi:hypothetical protein